MGGKEEAAQVLAAKFAVIFPHLDERQRRLPYDGPATIRWRSRGRVTGGDVPQLHQIVTNPSPSG
jgi:hypothetical protein